MNSLAKTWNDWPLIRKIYLVMACMAALLVFQLFALSIATRILSGARAFVTGEAIWSKAQKNAILRLRAIESTEDEPEYERHLKELDLIEGDRLARLEIEKPIPEIEIIRQGLIRGGNHPEDTDAMISLALRFRNLDGFYRSLFKISAEIGVCFNKVGTQQHP